MTTDYEISNNTELCHETVLLNVRGKDALKEIAGAQGPKRLFQRVHCMAFRVLSSVSFLQPCQTASLCPEYPTRTAQRLPSTGERRLDPL